MTDKLYTDLECKIILAQIARRAKYREEFLKARTDPCKHSMEAGYVFDPAIQRFMSMKACQAEYFQANPRTIVFGLLHLLPMVVLGSLVWWDRATRENEIRCGKLRYRDRRFKLA